MLTLVKFLCRFSRTNPPRTNFDDFFNAFLACFQVRLKPGLHIDVTIAEHACSHALKRILKLSTYRLQIFLVTCDCLRSVQLCEGQGIRVKLKKHLCACDPYDLYGDQAEGYLLTISMCGQRATGKIQTNNYHHGSCGSSLMGKTMFVFLILISCKGRIGMSKIVACEVAFLLNRTDSFVLMLSYCVNLTAIKYESTSLNRIVVDKSHRVIVASHGFLK